MVTLFTIVFIALLVTQHNALRCVSLLKTQTKRKRQHLVPWASVPWAGPRYNDSYQDIFREDEYLGSYVTDRPDPASQRGTSENLPKDDNLLRISPPSTSQPEKQTAVFSENLMPSQSAQSDVELQLTTFQRPVQNQLKRYNLTRKLVQGKLQREVVNQANVEC